MKIVCVICTELMVTNAHISAIQCGHLFHEECLSKWLSSGQKTCPQCRYVTTTKAIIKKLYFTECLDRTIASENIDSMTRESILNQIETFKSELRNTKSALDTKSGLLEKKEATLKELEANYSNAKKSLSERQILVDYLKKELDSYKKIKDQLDEKEKRIQSLESKLKEFKCVEMIYKGKKDAFESEINKYKQHFINPDKSFIEQLIRCNLLLKEHSDKQLEEKRQIRKKLLSNQTELEVKEKLIEDKQTELTQMKQKYVQVQEKFKVIQDKIHQNSKTKRFENINVNDLVSFLESLIENWLHDHRNHNSSLESGIINATICENVLTIMDESSVENDFIELGGQSKKRKMQVQNIAENDGDDDDISIIKPIKGKKPLTSHVYDHVYDGLGGHKKILNPSKKQNMSAKNLTKNMVLKSPFLAKPRK